MPVNYARDDVRRLITVSMHGPFDTRSLVDTLDRQVAEGTWAYARLYDERGVTVAPTASRYARCSTRCASGCATTGRAGRWRS